ncbi:MULTISPECIES: hypothetical protein [unclassified Streptomyces]|uniref:hypothetical protein n=1 Tax=unclassified Streptomyces TaxID=2593676 RepID=UPI00344F514A
MTGTPLKVGNVSGRDWRAYLKAGLSGVPAGTRVTNSVLKLDSRTACTSRTIVNDPVVPKLASVDLRFADGSRQRVDLTQDEGVWWLALGDGDPVKP